MRGQCYFLQYCFYAVALDRHLAARLPGYDYDSHFAGATYVFIRGLDSARPGWGVVRARPERSLIQALRDVFEAGGAR
jgi:exodeoxyribonuclease V beta subunit